MNNFRLHHLLVFSSLLVAQPVFDLLHRYPQYFVASKAGTWELVALSLALSIGPGLILIILTATVMKYLPVLRAPLQWSLVGLAAWVLAAQLLNTTGLESAFAVLSLLIAAALLLAYSRTRFLPTVCSALLPAIILVPGLFLFQTLGHPHLQGVLFHQQGGEKPPAANPVPVFYLVFDELPRYSLQGPDGLIDAARFPTLAAFAAEATWYRNASTVADSTEVALPALLSGRRPDQRTIPANYSAHPNNLLAALSPQYRMNIHEPVTRLCPPTVCMDTNEGADASSLRTLLMDSGIIWAHRSFPPGARSELPPIDESWPGFAGEARGHKQYSAGQARFEFLDSISRSTADSFNFAHIYLPHVPWKYLPSGRPYATSPREYRLHGATPGSARFRWNEDETAIALGYQRHLMQTAYVDRYLGELFEAIRERGLWDQALIIFVTDHGLSFRPNMPRRWVEAGNLPDILSVPLLIKYPGQVKAAVSDANAESVDIVATIADVLELSLWWQTDGVSLRNVEALAERGSKTFRYKLPPPTGGFRTEQLSPAILDDNELERRRQQTFGVADHERGLFDISTEPEWLGQQATGQAGSARVEITGLRTLQRYHRDRNRKLPAFLRGRLEGGGDARLALALNGVIRATTRTLQGTDGQFAAIIDEQFFEPSDNELQVFEITQSGLVEVSVIDAGD